MTTGSDSANDPPLAWINGHYVPAEDASLPLSDLCLHGVAATEMIRTFGLRPDRVDEHLDRLERSCAGLGIEHEFTRAELKAVIHQVADVHAQQTSAGGDLGINVLATAGGNPGLSAAPAASPRVCVTAFALPFRRWVNPLQEGVELAIPRVPALPKACVPANLKTRNRLHWYLATQEIRESRPGAVPLLVDQDGCLTETPTANFFIVRGDQVLTPSSAVLPGISREVVRELAAWLEMEYHEVLLSAEDVVTADEAFLSATTFCLLPVTRFEGSLVGDGRPGPVFFELCGVWSEQVGLDIIDQILHSSSEQA